MSQGISIHIGLEYGDPKVYGKDRTKLKGCRKDMKDMRSIALSQKFKPRKVLLNKYATRKNVAYALKRAAKKLKKGDILLLTYSGHGTYFKDEEGLEPLINGQRNNQAWCLYDGFMIDDELHYFWTLFDEGVRIFMISDSCHSGTMSKDMWNDGLPIEKGIIEDEARNIYLKNQKYYDKIKIRAAKRHKQKFGATVLLISGCQDDESSYIFPPYENSVLTQVITEIWNNGNNDKETYDDFFEKIKAKVIERVKENQKVQTPNISIIGKENNDFREENPFMI